MVATPTGVRSGRRFTGLVIILYFDTGPAPTNAADSALCEKSAAQDDVRLLVLEVVNLRIYVPPELIVRGGTESLALINNFIEIVENLRKDNSSPKGIADIISQLETDALVLTGKFVGEIGTWEKRLDKAGIPLTSRFGDLEETSWFWRNRHDKTMEAFEPTLKAVQQSLCGFIDDLVAIARCAGKEEILALSFQQAAELKKTIRAETDIDTHNIKDILAVNKEGLLIAQIDLAEATGFLVSRYKPVYP